MIINTKDLSSSQTYHLLTQTVIPRPIAWVLSENHVGDNVVETEQRYNIAPFSYFTAVSSDPALLMLSFASKDDGGEKDTLINISEKQHFVIHIATAEQMQAVQDTSTPLPYGESEMTLMTQRLVDFEGTSLKRLADVPIAFACRLYDRQEIGNAAQQLVFAEVTHCYVADHVVDVDGKRMRISAQDVNPLGRLGLGQFCDITAVRRP